MSYRLRSVLATSDLGETSDAGLLTAAFLSAETGAELHIVHCIRRPGFPNWIGLVEESTRAAWLQDARRELEGQIRRVIGDDVAVASIDVTIGEPAREIINHATSNSADVIVLGPHRKRVGFDDVLGTTADRVVRTSSVPCLIGNRPVAEPIRRALVPVDFSKPSVHAVKTGIDWLLSVGAGSDGPLLLEILYVSAFALPNARPIASDAKLAEQMNNVQERLPTESRVKILSRILSAPVPLDGIVRAAEESDTDLIIIGTHGHSTLGRALIGSVASGVVRKAPFPVLLVPPPASREV